MNCDMKTYLSTQCAVSDMKDSMAGSVHTSVVNVMLSIWSLQIAMISQISCSISSALADMCFARVVLCMTVILDLKH